MENKQEVNGTKMIYMEQTIQMLSIVNKDNPEFVKTLVERGQVKELKTGQKYLVMVCISLV